MHRVLISMFMIFFWLICPSLGQAADFQEKIDGLAEIKNIRVHSNQDRVRVVVDATQEVSYKTMVLSSPQRIVVDINGAWVGPTVTRSQLIDSGFASKVRISQFNANTVRVVVETNVGKDAYQVFSLSGGDAAYRVVMDFGQGGGQVAASQTPTAQPTSSNQGAAADVTAPVVVEPVYDSAGITGKTIVLDPGHGGSDSGAIGPTGVTEKSITLRVATELRQLLLDAGAKVLMTRTTDVDVAPQPATDAGELQARCDVANQAKADIFLSIHMDSFSNGSAKGTTGYYYAKGSQAGKRLADYVRQGVIDQIGTTDRGTKSCNFYVVKNTTMPASLVELAFVSNSQEETLMNSTDGIKKAAKGIFNGMSQYFAGN